MLTQEEYQHWIDYVKDNYFLLPNITTKDMDNWRHRSTLARSLVRVAKYAPAIELFKSILDVDVDTEEKDCFSLSEVEDKVWCLKELSICLWYTTGNRSETLKYLTEALRLIAIYPSQFKFMDKCEVWREIQDFIFFTSKRKEKKRRNPHKVSDF